MAGLENLTHLIYHERQQSGSMLCAQHALNSLLQGNYFTPPDLSDIARNLDTLEERYDDSNTGITSTNMDDTGFFSVQVLENALKVWGLNLTRWRGEAMRPYQDRPHTQLAFILNLEQHWFTLRRFGHADPNVDNDTGNGHWFNLNSSLPEPEWVGKLYLGMVLQQAEADGYSVFAVTQADPSAHLALIRTEADEVASTLPEPRSAARPNLSASYTTQTTPSTTQPGRSVIEGLEDEDYDLQAALQASMMEGGVRFQDLHESPPLAPPRLTRTLLPLPPSSDPQSPIGTDSGTQTPTEEYPALLSSGAPVDPVVASLERNQAMLQRMRAQQEQAQRELRAEGAGSSDFAALEARRQARQREEEEEAEELRRAIEESEALAKQGGYGTSSRDNISDDNMDIDEAVPQLTRGDAYPSVGAYQHVDRVYDDDDAELQAALKASLEQLPEGWGIPESPTHRTPAPPLGTNRTQHIDEDTESILSDETSTTTDNQPSDAPVEAVSVDELRRKRLARFGS